MNDFLADSPPGEYAQIGAALQGVTNNREELEKARSATFERYAKDQCMYVFIGDHPALICDEALTESGAYIDPVTGLGFHYNPNSEMVTDTGLNVQESSPLRIALQQRIKDYCLQVYKQDHACGAYDLPDGAVGIVFRASSISLRNFRTGIITAHYKISKEGALTGQISAKLHFFEGGNAMLEYSKKVESTMKMTDPAFIANSFVTKISMIESTWLQDLEDGLQKIGEEGLEKLRRKLPISKTKVDWEKELTSGGGMAQRPIIIH